MVMIFPMAIKTIKPVVIILITILLYQPGFSSERESVFVSILPQRYFVKQIGRELVDVHVMVEPGASPATYEPKPGQMVGLSKARIYFAIGVPFENAWLKRIAAANPQMRIVHLDHGIRKIPMVIHYHFDKKVDHSKEGEEQNEYGASDPHIWLSPPLVKVQARTILNSLQEIDPIHQTEYQANYDQFILKIDHLDAQLKTIFAGKQGLRFMVFHPAWGYFAAAYGLEQAPIEIEGKAPKPAQLKELIEHARESDIKVVFVQPQFSTKSARLIAGEIGGQIAFANPLAEDWLSNLREIAKKFEAALE